MRKTEMVQKLMRLREFKRDTKGAIEFWSICLPSVPYLLQSDDGVHQCERKLHF
jgi:hypothetical protein